MTNEELLPAIEDGSSSAVEYLFHERFNDIPLIQEAKRWITDDLHYALEDVTRFAIDRPGVYAGVDEATGWKNYVPGNIQTLGVIFKDEQVKFKNMPVEVL